MKRTIPAILLIFLLGTTAAFSQIKYVAITLEGIPVAGKEVNINWTMAMSYSATQTIKNTQVPAVGFVNEYHIANPEKREERLAIVESWLDAGVELGNGTFSDIPLSRAESLEWFEKDIAFGEKYTRPLAEQYGDTIRYFRYPDFDLGDDPKKAGQVEKLLEKMNYRPVTATIRFEDEYFNTPYINSKIENDTTVIRYIGNAYIKYIKDVLTHYEKLSEENFSRQITHILSLRASEINSDMLGYILSLLWERGYRFVTLEEALGDPLYRRLEAPYKGGFFWDHARGVEKKTKVEVPSLIKALYRRQTY